ETTATQPVTTPEPQPLVCAVDDYLGQVADGLPGPRRARAAILAELRAGLLDAAEAHRRAGLMRSAAAQAAAGGVGAPIHIAAAFRAELRPRKVRRIAVLLLASAPLIALAWTGAALGSHLGAGHALPSHWPGAPRAWHFALPLAAVGLILGATAAAAAVFASG